jgi:serine/threonine protein kinase/5-hydroxyisourate hydrolase-like protein (transthyretin family)
MQALKVLNSRYQLLSVIKRGGFGIIYKGYDKVLGKDIAVKEINPGLLNEAQHIDRFQDEARHAAKLSHQNIVHIFDLVRTEENRFYIVMEYINGLDLSRLLKGCQLRNELIPQHLAIYIVAEVCKALDYAHSYWSPDDREPLNLIHQDISPSNIMISNNGLVKLIDFGIATKQKRSLIEKNQMTFQGKFQYMSPEHVNSGTNPDKRSDLFSLGLVLFEALEGRRFFQNDDISKIVQTLRNGKLRLRESKYTPEPLRKVLNKALEKSPESRYQNANQFYIGLITYLVINRDTSKIETELGEFVSKFTLNRPENKLVKRKFTIKDSDNFFETVFDVTQKDDLSAGKPGVESIPFEEISEDDHYQNEVQEFVPKVKAVIPKRDDAILQSEMEAADEIKTVIDVVRLSTRGHKQLFIKSAVSLTGLIVILFILDIAFQWTQLGTGIYDYLFPPAIRISSVPAGAKAFLDNKPILGATPVSVKKIQPGVHELKLTLPGYLPIVKSIQVPRQGKVYVKGEKRVQGNRPYIFRFKTTLELDSQPQGAEVYINNIKFGQNTPFTVTWEVGEPCQIEMRKRGFLSISGFSLDTEDMVDKVEDRRFWKTDIGRDPYTRYKIKGIFGKFITIKSNPPNAAIYLAKGSNPIGVTGRRDAIFFPAANHKIILKKKGYNPKVINLKVHDSTPSQIYANLSRPVKFFALDASQSKGRDIGAEIKAIVRDGKTVIQGKRTPSSINLLPYDYYAVFAKKGYQDTKVQISPKDNYVVAKMVASEANVTVVILDAATGEPLSDVEVSVESLDNPNAKDEVFDLTDMEGTCSANLVPGLYVFRTSRSGYNYQEQSVMIQDSIMNLIEFNLSKP